jgi:hypothetical protein
MGLGARSPDEIPPRASTRRSGLGGRGPEERYCGGSVGVLRSCDPRIRKSIHAREGTSQPASCFLSAVMRHAEGSFVRWQATTLAQLGYAVNLILGFATASLGFALTLARTKDYAPGGAARCLWILSVLLLLASVTDRGFFSLRPANLRERASVRAAS